MNGFTEFFSLLMNSEELISKGGLILVTLIVFAETGLFFCFFLPGDYLLFTAGMFCGLGYLHASVWLVMGCILGAAVAGNYTGYFFGKHLGNMLMNRPDGLFFKKQYLVNTEKAFQQYGGNALIIGRFLPVIRTFAPILAGMTRMSPLKFGVYNIAGAALWVISLCLSGYYLGKTYPQIIDYVEYIILAFIILTSFAVGKSLLSLRKKETGKSNDSVE
jgi:membrane-associated protein